MKNFLFSYTTKNFTNYLFYFAQALFYIFILLGIQTVELLAKTEVDGKVNKILISLLKVSSGYHKIMYVPLLFLLFFWGLFSIKRKFRNKKMLCDNEKVL